MSSTPPLIQTGSVTQTNFQPSPINPDWIIEGNPIARALTLGIAPDQRFSCAVWECQAGRFKWVFGLDEIIHILEGEVIIEEAGTQKIIHTLRPGDTALLPAGLTAYWTVPKYLKKFAIHRSVKRTFLQRAISKLARLLGLQKAE